MGRPTRTQLAARRWALVNEGIEARREAGWRAARARLVWNEARPIRERKRARLIRSMRLEATLRAVR